MGKKIEHEMESGIIQGFIATACTDLNEQNRPWGRILP